MAAGSEFSLLTAGPGGFLSHAVLALPAFLLLSCRLDVALDGGREVLMVDGLLTDDLFKLLLRTA